ncbi:relaxase domain-containing protein [Streptomyces sp. NPDC059943]|uniref:relaxase domain-containing protein n=1 Tax=Streptomyces sp. NPDC059943 TaxID=3347010 RepID=UPI0036590251
MLSVKGQRLDGKWGSIHSEALFENTVAASALYNETVAAEACDALGLATEPRTLTAGRQPVMEIAGVPHELIRWTARRGDQIAACLKELEHEYVTTVKDDGELKYLPAVSERARVELMRMAAHKTRPLKKQKTRSLAQLRADWKQSAIDTSKVAADIINSLLERADVGEAVDLTALRDLRKSRTDVEALDFTAERLRRIRDAAASTVAGFRARADIRLGAELEGGGTTSLYRPPTSSSASHRQQPGSGRDHGIPR